MFMQKRTPTQTGSMPSDLMIGTKIGIVRRAIPTQPRKAPSTNRINIITSTITVGLSEMPVIMPETKFTPPIKL
ncbi:hypothetical protein D3C86_2104500 [compost metagenome]